MVEERLLSLNAFAGSGFPVPSEPHLESIRSCAVEPASHKPHVTL